jgi:putative selenium metabolism protein SsnA
MSLVLTGGTVVRSIRPPEVVRGDVVVDAGRIVSVGGPLPSGAARLGCSGAVVVPGNVCAHTHLYSALARGMPYRLEPPRTFVDILRRVWWRLDRALDPRTIRASALAGGMEALLAGTTTLVDHHASPAAIDGSLDLVADALGELGIRSVLCYETSDRDGPEASRAGLDENRRFVAAAARGERPLARAMVGAHASFTLSAETLGSCADAARSGGVGLHVHVAEDAADEDDALARFGLRVAHRLAAAGALDPRSLLAHGVHLDPSEVEVIRAAGATVVHNPRSNMNNAVGRAPVAALGERVALGTDGIGADMFEEARAAYVRRREDDVTTGPDWALGRLAESARVAGDAFGEPLLGRIEPGAPADLVVLDYHPTTPLDATNLAGHWIFGLSSATVRDVVVAGEVVVADRRLARVDQDALAADARTAARRLWARLGEIDVHPFVPPGIVARAGTGSREES